MKRSKKAETLMTVSHLGEGELIFRLSSNNKVTAKQFAEFNFPVVGKVDLSVEAVPTERYAGLTERRSVTVEM
jgi:hypothetical protein